MSNPAAVGIKRRRDNRSTTDEATIFPAELVQPRQLQSPPPTPVMKRRRRLQGVSEESGDEIVRLADDIRNEDYRTGGPVLCRLPTRSAPVLSGQAYQLWNTQRGVSLQDAVRKALKEWAITQYNLELAKRFFHLDEPLSNVETIFILTTKAQPTNNWLRACLHIRRICASYGLPEMNVEIADLRGLEPLESSGVGPTHRIVNVWTALRPMIIKILGMRDWLSLSLLRRGKASDPLPHPVTVVVTIDLDSEIADWDIISTEIAKLLDNVKLHDVMIEIGRGRVWRTVDDIALPAGSWTKGAKFGGSIKAKDPLIGSGTLGGIVRLYRSEGTYKDFGITCYHCVVSQKSTDPIHKTWAQKGLRPSDKPAINIDMPSPIDHDKAMTSLRSELAKLDTTPHRNLGDMYNDPETSSYMAKVDRRQYEIDRDTINAIRQQITIAEKFKAAGNMLLGHVLAGSGFRVAPNKRCTLDWALININAGREGRNILPDKSDIPNAFRILYQPMASVLGPIQKVQPDDAVFKIGRTTGVTAGRFQSAKETDTLHAWQVTAAGVWEEVTTIECAVITPHTTMFGKAGDSGSFVFNRSGRLVGLYFGGNDHASLSYFSSIEDVFDDIKNITGAANVTLPD